MTGSPWDGADLSGQVIREVDLSGADLRGAMLANTTIDGYIVGLRVNGVEVVPLVEAELDRLHPERLALRPTDADGVRRACDVVQEMWAPTLARAEALGEPGVHESVGGEWSFAQTLRHLVFVTDAWFGHAVAQEAAPFHPLGLPATFMTDATAYGIDDQATPSYAEVLAARDSRLARLRDVAAGLTDDDLARECGPNRAPGYPPPAVRTVGSCLAVIFGEEWEHHRFAVRDLTALESGRPTPPVDRD
mgnify:FL=1